MRGKEGRLGRKSLHIKVSSEKALASLMGSSGAESTLGKTLTPAMLSLWLQTAEEEYGLNSYIVTGAKGSAAGGYQLPAPLTREEKELEHIVSAQSHFLLSSHTLSDAEFPPFMLSMK